jgi:kynureninase
MSAREFDASSAGARALDDADPLAPWRARFELPRDHGRRGPLTYLCGHSLGLMPKAARRAVAVELERWAGHGVDGHFADERHDGWLGFHERFAAPLAALAGAKRAEVVAMNTLTVNLHLMLASFFRPTRERYKILIERHAFPSDRYAVESQLRWHGLEPRAALLEIAPREGSWLLDVELFEALLAQQGESIALVLLPGVQYLSGERLDVGALTAAAQRRGCRVGFDLAHAIGNVPLALHRDGPDFAVWCSSKYLNAGPGAVGASCLHELSNGAVHLARHGRWWAR